MTSLELAAETYLDRIDATGYLRERVLHFVALYGAVTKPGDLTNIFIDDAIDEEGGRHFDSLWLYGSEHIAECANFQFGGQDVWDIARLGGMKLVKFTSREFTPGTPATKSSRAQLRWTNDRDLTGTLTATGSNCDELSTFFEKCVRPRM